MPAGVSLLPAVPAPAGFAQEVVTAIAELGDPDAERRRFLLKACAIDADKDAHIGPPLDNADATQVLADPKLTSIEVAHCLWHDFGNAPAPVCVGRPPSLLREVAGEEFGHALHHVIARRRIGTDDRHHAGTGHVVRQFPPRHVRRIEAVIGTRIDHDFGRGAPRHRAVDEILALRRRRPDISLALQHQERDFRRPIGGLAVVAARGRVERDRGAEIALRRQSGRPRLWLPIDSSTTPPPCDQPSVAIRLGRTSSRVCRYASAPYASLGRS